MLFWTLILISVLGVAAFIWFFFIKRRSKKGLSLLSALSFISVLLGIFLRGKSLWGYVFFSLAIFFAGWDIFKRIGKKTKDDSSNFGQV